MSFDEHNIWNPMLGLLRHAPVGVSMEALLDEKDLEKDRALLSFRSGRAV